MSVQLKIDTRVVSEDTAVISLSGEVDVANSGQVKDAAQRLIADGAKKLVVDLAEVEYMDSSGLGTLVGLWKRIREEGGKMPIAGAQSRVQRVFEVTDLKQIFTLCADVDAALEEADR